MRVFVDMDGVLCDFEKAFWQNFIPGKKEFPQAEARFFENLEPIEGAIEGFKWLATEYDVWIATRPSIENPYSYTEKRIWVEENLGYEFVDKLILIPDKSLLIGDWLIDDRESGHGQDRFCGTLYKFNNWKEIKKVFSH